MRRICILASFAGALTLGCRDDNLAKIDSSLVFSSPDEPGAVTQPDPADVGIDLGQVGVQTVKTLTLQVVSNGTPIVLGALTAVQPDDELSLPLVPGTSVGSQPVQTVLTFAPVSLGDKTAVYTLATNATAAALVKLTLTGQAVPQALTVSPDPIDLGNVELNQTGTLSVTLTNHGASPATLALSSLAGASPTLFALDPLSSQVLAAGATLAFEAHFSPLVPGPASAAFTLSGCPTCGQLTVPLAGNGVESVLQVSPDPLHFGFIAPAAGALESVTIANTGNQVIHLLAPGPVLDPSAAESGFTFGPPQPTTPSGYPFALGAGQSAALPISFVPPRSGFFSGSLSFGSDDVGSPSVQVPLDGYGGGARIDCLPSAVSFGAVAVAQAPPAFGVESVVCTNVGSDVPGHPEAALRIAAAGLMVDNPLFTAAFAPDAGASPGGEVDLTAGQGVEIDVTYLPAAAGSDTGTLTIASNDSQTPDLAIALAGQGVVPGACSIVVAPPELSFGEVPVGGVGQQLFEISSNGQSYCLISNIALDPGSDPAFSLPGPNPSPVLLGYGGNPGGAPTMLRVPVQFTPLSSADQATGKVTFSASGGPRAWCCSPPAALRRA